MCTSSFTVSSRVQPQQAQKPTMGCPRVLERTASTQSIQQKLPEASAAWLSRKLWQERATAAITDRGKVKQETALGAYTLSWGSWAKDREVGGWRRGRHEGMSLTGA